jgi:hypothetical protein
MAREFLQKPESHLIYKRVILLTIAYGMYEERAWDCQLPEEIIGHRKISWDKLLTEDDIKREVVNYQAVFPNTIVYAQVIENEELFENLLDAIDKPFDGDNGMSWVTYCRLTEHLPNFKLYKLGLND